jgi:hypothetical protein
MSSTFVESFESLYNNPRFFKAVENNKQYLRHKIQKVDSDIHNYHN